MEFVAVYIIGVAIFLMVACLSGRFHWSVVNEPPPSVCDLRRRTFYRILLWLLVWWMLFGSASTTFIE